MTDRSPRSFFLTDVEDVVVDVRERPSYCCSGVVFTNGCFDVLHPGHMDVLDECAEAAIAVMKTVVVALNSDESCARLKGPGRPIFPLEQRARMVRAVLSGKCSFFYVVSFDEDTPEKLVERLSPDVIVKGGDYRPEDVVGASFAKKVLIVPFRSGFSTTSILERLSLRGTP